ncbi:hypothetical protein C8J56DRAFT_854108 [Mycena floridula]|nr:hypothetical protein C8J56DRAFT_854108 [Mycena floridula]
MQRRTGKGHLAHIAAPTQSKKMDSDSEKASSFLNRRSLGVINRIWLLVALLLSIITFTSYVLPSTTTHVVQRHTYSNLHLKSKNYLNSSAAEPNPFPFCPAYGPGDEIGARYGALVLSQSRMHLGSGARIQRVLTRVMAGQPVTISVLGSSVSACHGAGDDPISTRCYPSRFFSWWNSVFPHPATELTNGAMRRTNSAYYGYCSMHHIPDVTDMVIVELDSEDSDADTLENFELLIRSILLRPDQPAVLILGHFTPQIHQTHGFAGPDHVHNIVAQFYDVPHISTKAIVFPEYMRDPTAVSKKYFVDPVLASSVGHEVVTDVLIAYFQTQICSAWAVATGSSYETVPYKADVLEDAHGLFGGVGMRKGVPEPGQEDDDANVNRLKAEAPMSNNVHLSQQDVPHGRINTRPNSARPFQEIAPFCVSANDLINPLPPSLFYGSGWYSSIPETGANALQVKGHYWYSTLPTSKLRIPIQVGAGDIGVYYLQEPIAIIGEGSAVECWVDDNYAGAKIIENSANIGESAAKLATIDHYVTRGSHFVECQLLGEEGQAVPMFKVLGIFSS